MRSPLSHSSPTNKLPLSLSGRYCPIRLVMFLVIFTSLTNKIVLEATPTAESGANTLQQALLDDIMPSSSSSCIAGVSGTNSFTFDFTSNDATSNWDVLSKEWEENAFVAELSHIDADSDRSWKLRVAPGGNVYSFVGAYGEAMPPQRHSKAPWIDEVWQMVAVDETLHGTDRAYFIHQAGTYQKRGRAVGNTVFLSPFSQVVYIWAVQFRLLGPASTCAHKFRQRSYLFNSL